MNRQLLVIDFSAMWWTCWHSSGEDDLSAARTRTLRMIERFSRSEEWAGVAICLDSPSSWRRDEVATYKAQREPHTPQSLEQMRLTIEELCTRGYYLLEADGYEGDDVIASMTAWALHQGDIDVVILGVDKDLLQLLVPNRVTMQKFTDETIVTEAMVREKLSIGPELIVDWLALQGDKSDNIAGVKGVGPKRASALLQQYGSLKEVVVAARDSRANFTPAVRAAIIEADDSGALDEGVTLIELNTECLDDKQRAAVLTPATPVAAARQPVPAPFPASAPLPAEEDDDERAAIEAEPGEDVDAPIPFVLAEPPPSRTEPPPKPSVPRAAPPPAPPAVKPSAQQQSPPTSRALVPAPSGAFMLRLEPQNLEQAEWVADRVDTSRLCARKFKNADEVLMVIMAGAERGLGVWSAIKASHVIEGELCWAAQYIIGEAKKHPDCEYFYMKSSDERHATFVTKRRGTPAEEEVTVTIEDAELAGLCRPSRKGQPSNWVRIPKDMLRKDAGVKLARAVYPDATGRLQTPEEVRDSRVMEADYEVST